MFSDFPNLHPLVVHFPIVLILLGAVLQALLVFKDWQQVRWVTLLIMGAGFASALVASKVFHAHTAELPALANEIYQDHEKYSAYTLWVSGITFLLRGIGEFYRIHRRSYESLVFASSLVAAVFLSLTGHRGAQLVYLAGVGPQGHLVMTEDHEHGDKRQEKSQLMPAAGKDADQHQHGEPAPHPNNKPGASDRGEMHTGHAAGGGDSARQPDRHQHPASPAAGHKPAGPAAGGLGPHAAPQKPGTSQAEMPAMHHPTPGKKEKGKENMAAIDHSRMGKSKNKKAQDHGAMGHGATPAPGKAPAADHQAGMDHQATPAAGAHQQMEHAPGQGIRTDSYGRPLLDPAEPYDNNPAREQAPRRPKGQ
jgi:uncharacterized membrane protein